MPTTHLEAYDKAKNYLGMARDTGRGDWHVICLVDQQTHEFKQMEQAKNFFRQVGAAVIYEMDGATL